MGNIITVLKEDIFLPTFDTSITKNVMEFLDKKSKYYCNMDYLISNLN